MNTRKQSRRSKHESPEGQPRSPVMGLEAEFSLILNGAARRPEALFQSPQTFVRAEMIPRTGRSFSLPSGGAVYFDTGVIEVATPIIEMGEDCCERAVRSLWEQIRYLRGELDHFETVSGNVVKLAGFSTHYNFTFPVNLENTQRTVHSLAWLLCHILPLPIMLLAANRRSTGIGVRPREGRIEITADFTPDPDLMTAAVSAAAGISRSVMNWSDYDTGQLKGHRVPVLEGFRPRKHSSRKGWVARFDCYSRNPFMADPNERHWHFRDGRIRSLREAARDMLRPFVQDVAAIATPDCMEHIFAVFDGRARSLLDFDDRPASYDDVGRVFHWKRRCHRALPLSRYERVVERVLSKRPLWVDGAYYRPVRIKSWYEIAFREVQTGRKRIFNLDDLAAYCG